MDHGPACVGVKIWPLRRQQTLRVPKSLIRDGLHDALNFLAEELSQRPDIHQRDAATLEAN
jgi:hypothetical protein